MEAEVADEEEAKEVLEEAVVMVVVRAVVRAEAGKAPARWPC